MVDHQTRDRVDPRQPRVNTRDQARLYLFDYIEVFYNRQRHQTGLGHLTPVEFAGGFTP